MFRRSPNTPQQPGLTVTPVKESLAHIITLKIGFVLFFVVVGLRLLQIQVKDASVYQEIAKRQYESKVILPATRGSIYDRNGRILVSNSMFVSFAADPWIVGSSAGEIASRFARAFGKPRESYLSKLNDRSRRFVWLERRAHPEIARQINASEFEGVIQLDEPKRIYHHDHVGGQMIGFTDVDNNGLSGIELQFNGLLKGTDGYVIMQRDGLGRKRPSVDYPRIEPVNGHNIALTIDLDYQAIAEDELRKGTERNKAESGLVVMMEPSTGEVLAMANYPGIDPNNVSKTDPLLLKNRTLTDVFEPGSVFKIVTVSAALEHGLVTSDQRFFAENGEYVVTFAEGKKRIITDTHEYGMITFREAMEHSSNIVMAKVSDILGAELLYTTARDFGFGTATGIELGGEVDGELKKPNQWSGATLNSMAYGYEVAVTPLQIAAAYSVVAAGGMLMKPSILKQELDEHNEVVAETYRQTIRRVISKETAQTLTSFLEGVVEHGTGVSARLDHIQVAGKTGTSRKVIDGKYEPGNYTASFAGFLPTDDPKVVCLVMLDNPREGGYTGGLASAPIFKGIAEKVVSTSERFMQTSPVVIAGRQLLAVPDVGSLSADVATTMLDARGFRVETRGNGKIVLRQSPSPGTKIQRGGLVKLSTEEVGGAVSLGYTRVPDVRGLTVRRAINRLTMQQLDVTLHGSGIVKSQSPPAGEVVKIGSRIVARCEPKNLGVFTLY
ncbi:MAG: Peptidoglycan glycosyltransferase [Bacteroidetes bacterium]|nr:Peptidoglycan glycosyltransferase [Bacteroidota bacterium]